MKIIKLSDYKSSVAREFFSEIQHNDYKTILADPPWRFQNRTGKMAPEHKRLNRYPTLLLDEIKEIPVHLKDHFNENDLSIKEIHHTHFALFSPNFDSVGLKPIIVDAGINW